MTMALVVAVLLAGSLAYALRIGAISLSTTGTNYLIPGPEGPTFSNFGVQPGVYSPVAIAQNLTSIGTDSYGANFYWIQNSASEMTIGKTMSSSLCTNIEFCGLSPFYSEDKGQFTSEIQSHPTVGIVGAYDYYTTTKNTNGSYTIKEMSIQIAKVQVHVSIFVPSGTGWYNWGSSTNGFNIWYQVDNTVWENAWAQSPPPSQFTSNSTLALMASNFRGGFPIFAYINGYSDWTLSSSSSSTLCQDAQTNACSHVQVDPSYTGRTVDLYNQPSTIYTDLTTQQMVTNPQTYTEALAQNNFSGLPDPRFSQTAYFYVTLDNFGAYVVPTYTLGVVTGATAYYPAINYNMTFDYALFGQYVYLWTPQVASQVGYVNNNWTPRNVTVAKTGFQGFSFSWPSWLNPTNILIAAIAFVLVVIVILVALVTISTKTNPLVRSARRLNGMRRVRYV